MSALAVEAPTAKLCTRCGRLLPMAEFHRDANAKGGRNSQCRTCVQGGKDHDALRERQRARNQEKRRTARLARLEAEAAEARALNLTYGHMRRALLAGAPEVERVDWLEVMKRDSWICGICRWPIEPGQRPSLDHIIPLGKGGSHIYSNVQAAHLSCNISKSDKLPEEMEEQEAS